MGDGPAASVVVARPGQAGARLAARIVEAGAEAVHFPAIEIVPVTASDGLEAAIDALADADWAIFVSPSAAVHGVDAVRARLGRWPDRPRVAAVGGGTARALDDAGVAVDLVPEAQRDSEALLATPQLKAVAGASIVILRGVGGRPLLAETLSRRGARVCYAECYRRLVTRADPALLIDRWRRRPFNTVVVTSVDVFDALVELLGRSVPLLLDADLVVVSDRIGHACRERGCRAGITVAAGADDESILQSLGLAGC